MQQAALMIIVKDGLILGVSRGLGSDKYGVPGGKLNPGEDPMTAAIREAKEESSLSVTKCTLIARSIVPSIKKPGLDFDTFCYYADEWSGEPVPSDEGNVKWLTYYDLVSPEMGAFPEYNRFAIQMLRKQYPEIGLSLIQNLCKCMNTGWQIGDNEGLVCDMCDRACICGKIEECYSRCPIHDPKYK